MNDIEKKIKNGACVNETGKKLLKCIKLYLVEFKT